jgi:VIT1/CCC1 family predicted Fe2+/Mn2+ transporter
MGSDEQPGPAPSDRHDGQRGSAAQEADRDLFAEKERIGRLGRIREFVFGSLDGLLVPLGVVSGVAAGTNNNHAVIVAGIAEAFAGALSMGAGEFISGRSEAQVQQAEIAKEREEMRQQPDAERREMVRLLEGEGIATADAESIVALLVRYPTAYQHTMVEKELGLPTDPDTIRTSQALTMGLSYIVGSIFPLLPYFFFPISTAFVLSIALTFVALVVVGIIKGRLAEIDLVRSVLEVVVVGGVSAAGGYLLGTYVPRLLGF